MNRGRSAIAGRHMRRPEKLGARLRSRTDCWEGIAKREEEKSRVEMPSRGPGISLSRMCGPRVHDLLGGDCRFPCNSLRPIGHRRFEGDTMSNPTCPQVLVVPVGKEAIQKGYRHKLQCG